MTRAQAPGMREPVAPRALRARPSSGAGSSARTRTAPSTTSATGGPFSSLLRGWMQARGGELEAAAWRCVDEGLQAYLRSGALLGLSRFYVLPRRAVRRSPATAPGASRDVAAAEQHISQTGERYRGGRAVSLQGPAADRLLPGWRPAPPSSAPSPPRAPSWWSCSSCGRRPKLAELERTSGIAALTAGRVAELLRALPGAVAARATSSAHARCSPPRSARCECFRHDRRRPPRGPHGRAAAGRARLRRQALRARGPSSAATSPRGLLLRASSSTSIRTCT